MTSKIERGIRALSRYDLIVKHFDLAFDQDLQKIPHLEFDRASYPGFEAHLFTIADAAMWTPEYSSMDEVVLIGPKGSTSPYDSWIRLLDVTNQIMKYLEFYRQDVRHGIIPSTNWLFNENQWYRRNWEHPQYKVLAVDEFLPSVDESIRAHIKELNDLGFPTTQSCSGLEKDHPDRDPYLPYVMFDERAYQRSSAHLFTLADIAGWIPSYGPHNFDIEFRLLGSRDAEARWDKLVASARTLAYLLQDYRTSIKPDLVVTHQQFQIL
jgi:hypothetical protein